MSADERRAVFISYASQDADAARRICEALRAAGVEVWFDQSELVGGDSWDAKIRRQIKECALLIPVISQNTQARTEGYFRLEWRLADQRTHLMARGRAFLLPVVIDDTRDADAHVPDSFSEVQWTRLPGGEASAAFAARVKKLLGAAELEAGRPRPAERGEGAASPIKPKPRPIWPWVVSAAVALSLACFIFKPHRGPGETAKAPAPAQTSGSKPEVAGLLAKVRTSLNRIDTMRTELDTLEGLLGQAAKLDPTDAAVWATWARLDRRYLDEYYDPSPARKDAARRHAAQAQALDPHAPDVRMVQALVMRALSDEPATKEAATKILEALQREIPDNGEVPIELGWLAFERGRADEALAWFDRAVLVPGNAAKAHFAKAQLLVFIRRTAEAGPEFDRALAAERASKILLWKSYILMSWDGDLAAARQALNEVPAQAFVEDMPAMTRYYLEMLSRHYDQAVAAIRAVPHDYLQSVAYSGPAGYFKGRALALAGKTAAAELERRSALATVEHRLVAEPNDADLLIFKALLQGALGDVAAGRRTWKTMQELYPTGIYDQNQQLPTMELQPPGEAFAWAEQKVAKGAEIASAAQLRLDPAYDPIRSDPRFPALLARAEADPRLSPNAKAKPAVAPMTVDEKSVAVLAFANLSDDKANEYFSDGISEELLNVLAKIPDLKVSARTSAFSFKGKEVPVPEIARQLGVAYVVEGSVRRQGDRVRITAQLIKADGGFHVWSDTFTRDLKDIFAVQDEIAGLIAENLRAKMAVGRERSAVAPEAYALVLQARHAAAGQTIGGRREAVKLYREALTLAPGDADAWAELAYAYQYLARFGGLDTGEGMREARLAARKALELDPEQPLALAAFGWVQRTDDHDWRGAVQSFRHALAAAPENVNVMSDAAICFLNVGRNDEAVTLATRATERDPLNPQAFWTLGIVRAFTGDLALAEAPYRRAIELAPTADEYHSHLARVLTLLNRLDEAKVLALAEPSERYRLVSLAGIYFRSGDAPAGKRALDELAAKYGDEMAGYIAAIWAQAGNRDESFKWLERAYERRDSAVAWSKTSKFLENLTADPRWPVFLRKLGLTDEQLK